MVIGMLLPMLLLALSHPGMTADGIQDTSKGASLLRGCQAELRLMQTGALTAAGQSDLLGGTYCVGYVNGFVANFAPTGGAICPGSQPMAELVHAYVSYMEHHPQMLEEDKRIGLRLALQEAFPCPVSSDSVDAQVRLRRNRL